MRTSAIISSSLLAIAVSGAPVNLPKLPLGLSNSDLLPAGVPLLPSKVPTEFSATLPFGVPTGVPVAPNEPVNGVTLLVKNLHVKRAELPVVNNFVESIEIPNLVTLPTLPETPVGNLNLPVRRADVPIVGDILKDVTLADGVDPKVHLPLPVSTLPVNTGLKKKAVDAVVSAQVNVTVDDLVEIPAINVPTIAVPDLSNTGVPAIPASPKTGLAFRDIKQSLPVVGSVDVPLDAGEVQVGTVDKGVEELANGIEVESLPNIARDIKQSLPVVGGADVPLDTGNVQLGTVAKYVDDLVKGAKVESLPKVARDIEQSLPVVSGVKVPLDAGRVNVGTVDKDVVEVVEGTAVGDVPILAVVKDTNVKDLPNLGRRAVKQTPPVVGGVDVPLDAGKIQAGNADNHVGDVVKNATVGA